MNASSRFGKGFYVAEQPGTALAELAHHGVAPTTRIRFSVNQDALRVLDLTDASVARAGAIRAGRFLPIRKRSERAQPTKVRMQSASHRSAQRVAILS